MVFIHDSKTLRITSTIDLRIFFTDYCTRYAFGRFCIYKQSFDFRYCFGVRSTIRRPLRRAPRSKLIPAQSVTNGLGTSVISALGPAVHRNLK